MPDKYIGVCRSQRCVLSEPDLRMYVKEATNVIVSLPVEATFCYPTQATAAAIATRCSYLVRVILFTSHQGDQAEHR